MEGIGSYERLLEMHGAGMILRIRPGAGEYGRQAIEW